MRPRPLLNRELLVPIAVAIVSILGLGWIFLTNDLGESLSPPTLELEATAVPFDIGSLQTAVWTPPSVTADLNETQSTAAGTSPTAATLPSASALATESGAVLSATPAPDQLLLVGRHDDTDLRIAYDRHWASQMNSGTVYAYKGTLHVSSSSGSEASFYFTGQRFDVGYQRGRTFGIVTVLIDGEPYSFHEQAFGNLWRSPELSPGIHFVRLIHESGEAVNLDYIEVRD